MACVGPNPNIFEFDYFFSAGSKFGFCPRKDVRKSSSLFLKLFHGLCWAEPKHIRVRFFFPTGSKFDSSSDFDLC